MIKINQILKYLKKNIYLVCLAIVLAYIAYDKLYKKEDFENLEGYKKFFGDSKISALQIADLGNVKGDINIALKNDGIKKGGLNTIRGISHHKPLILDLSKLTNDQKIWVDMNSIKINGSKKLVIGNANHLETLNKQLNTCQDVNVQNNNLKKDLDEYKNKGFFARLFNWQLSKHLKIYNYIIKTFKIIIVYDNFKQKIKIYIHYYIKSNDVCNKTRWY